MKIATIDYMPTTLLTGTVALGHVRAIKPGNLEQAKSDILAGKSHAVKLYRDGDVKDGWHYLNALNILVQQGRIEETWISVEIHD